MKAVIMAGGFGTRLRPLTTHIPKPLVPVGNVPIMEHTVRLLKRHGFTDLLVLLYFLPETMAAIDAVAIEEVGQPLLLAS